MGITISAKGRIDGIDLLGDLVAHFTLVARANGWTFSVIDDDFEARADAVVVAETEGGAGIHGNLGLKGLCVRVDPQCEYLSLLFGREGVLTDAMNQIAWLGNGECERHTCLKTQFGSIESHIRVIDLLDELKRRYVSDLGVIDEGGYWESRDRAQLERRRAVLKYHLEQTIESLIHAEVSEAERDDPSALADKIVHILEEQKRRIN